MKKLNYQIIESMIESMVDIDHADVISTHVKMGIPIEESPLRLESDSFWELVCVTRRLYEKGLYQPKSLNEKKLMSKLKSGEKGVYDGKDVKIDVPFVDNNGSKRFAVYRPSGKKDEQGRHKAKIIRWGDPKLTVKNDDKEAVDSFWARHKCDTKTDPNTAGWWACYAPQLFGDKLKLSGGKSQW